MIATKIYGGLGNQMFQYALGRSLSLECHKKLLLDLSHLVNQPKNEVPRKYELDIFNINAKTTLSPLELDSPKLFLSRTKPYKLINERGFPFKPEILKLSDYSLLDGYWQCERYFIRYEDQIRKDFAFKKPLSKQKQLFLDEILKVSNPISLHVRRGDYVNHKASNSFQGLAGLDYYNRAVSEIVRKIEQPHFFVISDDQNWCKSNIKFNYPTTFVDSSSGPNYEDMLLMSRCQHHIIANSSFSWWGAWLNPSSEKIVIAPKNWFKEKSADASDIVPSSWTKV